MIPGPVATVASQGRGIFCAKIRHSCEGRLCHNSFWSLRATAGSVAIFMFSMPYEIASVVSLPRNDIMTQSERQESRNALLKRLDARLRGHDGKNSPTLN